MVGCVGSLGSLGESKRIVVIFEFISLVYHLLQRIRTPLDLCFRDPRQVWGEDICMLKFIECVCAFQPIFTKRASEVGIQSA